MDASTLRGLQAPLKERYRERPGDARVLVRAEGRFEGDGVTCTVPGWAGEAKAGLHPSTGGDGSEACSADMLLEALVACAGVTLRAVATAMEIPIRGATVSAEGHFDARGTLGIDKAAPVGLTDIALRFDIDTDAPADKVARLVELAERYCVIYQTLKAPPEVSVTHAIGGK